MFLYLEKTYLMSDANKVDELSDDQMMSTQQ